MNIQKESEMPWKLENVFGYQEIFREELINLEDKRRSYKFRGYVEGQSNKKFEHSQVLSIILFHPRGMITKLI